MKKVRNVIVALFALSILGILLLSACTNPQEDFEKAQKLDTIKGYQEFLDRHPQSEFSLEVKERIEELEWKNAEKINTLGVYNSYCSEYPSGRFVELARKKIEEFEWEETKKGHTENSYRRFLNKFPNSSFATMARQAIEDINIQNIRTKGAGNRFTIPDLRPDIVPETRGTSGGQLRVPYILKARDSGGRITIKEGSSPEEWVFEKTYQADQFSASNVMSKLHYFVEWGNGTVLRFKGKISLGGHTFEGEDTDPLSFILLQEGFTYLHGKGRVTLRNGEVVTF